VVEMVAETCRFPVMGVVLVRVGKSDTVPVPAVPAGQNPWVYLYLHSTLIGMDMLYLGPGAHSPTPTACVIIHQS